MKLLIVVILGGWLVAGALGQGKPRLFEPEMRGTRLADIGVFDGFLRLPRSNEMLVPRDTGENRLFLWRAREPDVLDVPHRSLEPDRLCFRLSHRGAGALFGLDFGVDYGMQSCSGRIRQTSLTFLGFPLVTVRSRL